MITKSEIFQLFMLRERKLKGIVMGQWWSSEDLEDLFPQEMESLDQSLNWICL